MKLRPKQERHQVNSLPDSQFTYGRALRPQTPVNRVMKNEFGEESQAHLQEIYKYQKQHRRGASKCPTQIPLTNAQMHADNAVRAKIAGPEIKTQFKLKRFQEVEPRTSTKRGEKAFMMQVRKPAM